jgi:S-adenosylmethionine-diacylgycerolhomoserine-N-methlytransferase
MDQLAGARMDAIYRGQRHIYDLTRKYYLLGRDRMLRELEPPPGGTVLEVGCGTARNLIVAARRFPQARFHGFDISTAMLETAQIAVRRAGLAERIRLARADATRFDTAALFGHDGFDRVFLSFTVSMIPRWREALAAAARAVAPGGRLEIVDFGQQERLPRAFRSALFAWLAAFEVTPRAALPDALAEVAARHDFALTFEPRLRGYVWRARLTRAG